MTPHSLWNIILKIFGLYVFLQVVNLLPSFFATLGLAFQGGYVRGSTNNDWSALAFNNAYFLLHLGLLLWMFNTLVFKTDWLISRLHLLNGVDEEKLELNPHRSTVLFIAVFISGLILLTTSIPALLSNLFTYYQNTEVYGSLKNYPNTARIVLDFVAVVIGVFMMTSTRLIVNFMERKRRAKPEVSAENEI